MQLKISSITNLTDARFFSAIGAHYLGFCFDVLNENNISITKAQEIIGWLHEPVIVAEFGVHQTKEEIEFIAQQLSINEIQIPFNHPQKDAFTFEKFLVIDEELHIHPPVCTDYFVLKVNKEDIGNPAIKNFISNNKVIIETNFSKDNISHILETLQPYGIQITCKKEEKAGWSAVDEYAELLDFIGFS